MGQRPCDHHRESVMLTSFPVCVSAHTRIISTTETSQIQFYQAFLGDRDGEAVCLSGRCIDFSKLLLAFLTWQLLSDLPPHRIPDFCKLHALTRRLGNRFLFRQSWRRWFSQCWPGRWTSSPCRCSLLSDCRDQHTWRVGQNSQLMSHLLKSIHTFRI